MRLFLLASVAFTVSAGAAGAAPIWTVSSAATAAYAELFADNGTVVRQVSLGGDIDPRGIAGNDLVTDRPGFLVCTEAEDLQFQTIGLSVDACGQHQAGDAEK